MSLSLATVRLNLRPVVAGDWLEYHAILSDPAMARRSDLPRKPTQKRTQSVIRWMALLNTTGKGFAWMIRESGTNQLIGAIRINSIDKRQSTGVLGYEIASAKWGRGYGTEALRAMVQHSHHAMGLFRLEAWTLQGNPQSDRVLLKAGFRQEGTQRMKMLLDGERLDMHLFGRLADDPIAADTASAR
jgi:ribosomal-protein-alanine N-acetyltransferase